MSEEEKIHVQLSAHQVALAFLLVNYIYPLRERTAWFILLVVLLAATAVRLIFGDEVRLNSPTDLAIGLFTFGGSWLVMMYMRVRREPAVSRMYNEGFDLSLRAEGIVYQVGASADVLTWDKFVRLESSGAYLFLFFNRRWALIIPRHAFATGAMFEHWREQALTHVPSAKLS